MPIMLIKNNTLVVVDHLFTYYGFLHTITVVWDPHMSAKDGAIKVFKKVGFNLDNIAT